MIHCLKAEHFEEWRVQARSMLVHEVLPTEVVWDGSVQPDLFGSQTPPLSSAAIALKISPDFMQLAKTVGCHRDTRRWGLLYQLLWRLTHGDKNLLHITTDPLMHALLMMKKAVRRDAHKMKAFVRFRLTHDDDQPHYIAWHRPDHLIIKLVAPFFARRFSVMRWTILTPDESVHWDGVNLHYGAGVAEEEAPKHDDVENLWLDYYRAIFNPARIKIKTMRREMPVRHWATLPEASLIASMLAEAPERVQSMIAHTQPQLKTAADFLPLEKDLPKLAAAAAACQGCELHKMATQTVFGRGPTHANLMIVGEQPGNDEDLSGIPFIGPSGQIFDQALEAAGLRREDIYITNAVKHFRFIYKDSFRQHQSPSRYHMHACKPWLDAEIEAVKPKIILCLGNIAARSLINPGFFMKQHRGKWSEGTPRFCGTYHPSAILRATGEQQNEIKRHFFEDVRNAAQFLSLTALSAVS